MIIPIIVQFLFKATTFIFKSLSQSSFYALNSFLMINSWLLNIIENYKNIFLPTSRRLTNMYELNVFTITLFSH